MANAAPRRAALRLDPRRLVREQRPLGQKHRRDRLRQRVEIIRLAHLVRIPPSIRGPRRHSQAAAPPSRSSRRCARMTRLGNSARRGRKLAPAYAWYASSTTTIPGAARRTASTPATSKRFPVGLLGYASKTSAGSAPARSRRASPPCRARSPPQAAHRRSDAPAIERVHPVHHERGLGCQNRDIRPRHRDRDDLEQLIRSVAENEAERLGDAERLAQRPP